MSGDAPQQPGQEAPPPSEWQFKPDDSAPADQAQAAAMPMAEPAPSAPQPSIVTWTASEFVAHHKTAGWYMALGIVAVVFAAFIQFISHDIIATVVVVIVAIIFGVAAGTRPRVLSYQLDEHGLTIGQKPYPYGDFKSFAVADEGAFLSVTLMPLKRFMPPLTIYLAPEDQEKIMQVLSQHLPADNQAGHDMFDRFVHKVRF